MRSPAGMQMPVALLVGALVASAVLVPVAAVAQDPPAARSIDRVCPPPDDVLTREDAVDFPDVGTTHGQAIVCAAQYGIITGFADGTVRPDRPVTRGQLATLLARWVRTAIGFSLPVPGERAFSDTDGSTHADAIDALAAVGIVGGREDGTFGPGDPLTRAQLAATVAAAISFADVLAVDGPLPPDDSEVTFLDTVDSLFEAPIRALAGIGVVQGTGDGLYTPQATVTRGQLATFLMRSADYLDRQQRWRPTAEVVVVLVRLRADEVVGDTGPDGPGGDDPAEGETEDPDADAATPGSATAVLTINAFNGTMAYALDVSDLDGPFGGTDGATLHLGVAGQQGPVVLPLATGDALDDADADVLTGIVIEADSAVRFADMIVAPSELYLQIATSEQPAGAVRGQLAVVASAAGEGDADTAVTARADAADD
jgi:hypothetical protein